MPDVTVAGIISSEEQVKAVVDRLVGPFKEEIARDLTGNYSSGPLRAGPAAARRISSPQMIVCETIEFEVYFYSTSGHPTSVVMSSVARQTGKLDFIVTAMTRRFPVDWDDKMRFKEELKQSFPDLLAAEDVEAKFSVPYPGASKKPTKFQAVYRAFAVQKDYIVWYVPQVPGYADLTLQLYLPEQVGMRQAIESTGYPYIPIISRLTPAVRSAPPVCARPQKPLPRIE